MASDWLMRSYLTGAATAGGAQSNPALSLGLRRSSSAIADFDTTVTTAATADTFRASALVGQDVDPGWWLSMHEPGANLNAAREVLVFDDVLGELVLREPLPAAPAVGHHFRLWRPNGLFSSFSAAQSVDHPTFGRHRCIALRNETGGVITGRQAWIVPLKPGPLKCEIVMGCGQSTDFDALAIASDTDAPDVVTGGAVSGLERVAGNSGSFRPQRWDDPQARNRIFETPIYLASLSWGANQSLPLWIRLRFRDGEPMALPFRSVHQIVFEQLTTGTPSASGSVLVVVDIDGPDEVLTAGVDRTPRISGGARLEVRIRDQATGQPVPNRRVQMTQTSGPGILGPQSGEVTTESGETIRAVYLAPTDPVEEGAIVDFAVEVF